MRGAPALFLEPNESETGRAELVELIPALRAFARSFCREPTDADDLVQETLTRAIANLAQFQPGTRMKSWLFTIMRNAFYTRVKRDRREATGGGDCASTRPVMEASQEWALRGKEMQAALLTLPQAQREIIVLIGVLGFSYEDAASVCGCAVGTVKSRLNRARMSLVEYFGEATAQAVLEPAARHFVGTLAEPRAT